MRFPLPFLGIQLRPVVLCAAGISAAAATSFLLYRWRVRDRQQTEDEAAARSVPVDRPDNEGPFSLDQDIFETPCSLIPKPHQALNKANGMFAYTFSRVFATDAKMVEVKLQHKTLYRGLESEHWWVLNNEFYNVCAELILQHFASVNAVACIKRTGTSITEATIYLRTESTEASAHGIFLQTKVSRTFKGISIGSDGVLRSKESSHTQILETPNPAMFYTRPTAPRGPPPTAPKGPPPTAPRGPPPTTPRGPPPGF